MAKVAATYPGWTVDPETELCVTCGSTEAMIATLLATVDPGDEVVVFTPYYENYGPDAVLSGATPRFVRLHAPDWSIDEGELRAALTGRTRAIIVNTPHNPTGKVFTRAELDLVSELCQTYDVLCLTDEIYEHIHYLGPGGHVPPATVPGLEDRTVTINAVQDVHRHRLAGRLEHHPAPASSPTRRREPGCCASPFPSGWRRCTPPRTGCAPCGEGVRGARAPRLSSGRAAPVRP